MGKRKKPPEEELDRILELEKQLKTERTMNKHLLRKIKKLDRKFLLTESLEEEEEEIEEDLCPRCARGKIEVIDLGIRKFSRCAICFYRTPTVKS